MNYDVAQEIAEGIFWIGYQHEKYGLHSNPYLMVQGDEAILIDAGSRPDFSTVVVKILDAGVSTAQISKLLYHHYDPDVCGSLSTFENLIDNPHLEVISQSLNNIFIDHYSPSIKKNCINVMKNSWSFKNGRTLSFINTPYAHSPGAFVTYDAQAKVLFSSDIFGTYSENWKLFFERDEQATCAYFSGLKAFHETIMPSKAALDHALDQIENLDVEIIAPQHGSIILGRENVQRVINALRSYENIGIDRVLKTHSSY